MGYILLGHFYTVNCMWHLVRLEIQNMQTLARIHVLLDLRDIA